jgi:hypothetical protein
VSTTANPFQAFPGPCTNAFCGQAALDLRPLGTASRAASSVLRGSSGIETWFVSPKGFDLPTVKARIVNREKPALSADLPTVRHSTIAALDPKTLSFPGAGKGASGVHSNLVLTELSPLLASSPMTVLVEIISPAGELLASESFVLNPSTIFLTDIVGRLGVSELHDGQVRVSKLEGSGLLWGVLATFREDGTLSMSPGVNP